MRSKDRGPTAAGRCETCDEVHCNALNVSMKTTAMSEKIQNRAEEKFLDFQTVFIMPTHCLSSSGNARYPCGYPSSFVLASPIVKHLSTPRSC